MQTNATTSVLTVTDTAWAEVPFGYNRELVLYSLDFPFYLSLGRETPHESTSVLIPAGSSIELSPLPEGIVYMQSVGGSQSLYIIGA